MNRANICIHQRNNDFCAFNSIEKVFFMGYSSCKDNTVYIVALLAAWDYIITLIEWWAFSI